MDKINTYIEKHDKWSTTLRKLRKLCLDAGLEESIKWGIPSYGINDQNVVGLAGFKHHTGVWFHQGALLRDESNVLINAQKGKTKAMRSIKIEDQNNVDWNLIKEYIIEATQNAKDGKKIAAAAPKKVNKVDLKMPPELLPYFTEDPELSASFKKLTAIQQRDYYEYIHSAKRAATKANRINKILPIIKSGKPISTIWTK